jgi:hypothetical protein
MSEFWDKALLAPLAMLGGKVLALLPNLLAMAIILTAGLIVAWATSVIVEHLLRVVGIDHLSNRTGVSAALARGGVKSDVSHLVGRATYWVVILFAAIAAIAALDLQPINRFAQSFLAYIPHLMTAMVILLAGYLLSNFVSQAVLIGAVNAGLPPARAIAMALEQLGIAEHIVVVGFGITFGGVVMAAAIAFGLGARDLAKDFLERRLSDRYRDGAPDDLRHL